MRVFDSCSVYCFFRRINHCEAGKKGLQIEPEMQFGCRFTSPVLCPFHAVGYRLNRGGIDDMNRLLESLQDRAESLRKLSEIWNYWSESSWSAYASSLRENLKEVWPIRQLT